MENARTQITVEVTIDAPIEKVWKRFNAPEHVTQWSFASDDWHAPKAENDFRVGGESNTRMEAKDGSFGFDFKWIYTNIKEHREIDYTLEDDRKVSVRLEETGNGVKLTQTFEAESENPVEMQQFGWQAILNNFKKHVEQH